MDLLTLVLIIAVVVNIVITTLLLLRDKNKTPDEPLSHLFAEFKSEIRTNQLEGLIALKDTVEKANHTLHTTLADGNSTIDKRLSVVNEIENKLGQLSKQTSNLEVIGKNIQSLSDIFKTTKNERAVW